MNDPLRLTESPQFASIRRGSLDSVVVGRDVLTPALWHAWVDYWAFGVTGPGRTIVLP
jgi:hypothetical protein